MSIPVFTFAAYSGVGKTTYLEKLIPCLKKTGVNVAVIKHDCHDVQLDVDGKDTDRLSKAGANPVAIASPKRFMYLQEEETSLQECLLHIKNVDLIFTEGFKLEEYPKIALYRKDSGQPLAVEVEKCFAIVSDTPVDAQCPQFPLDDPVPFANYLVDYLKGTLQKTHNRTNRLSIEEATEKTLRNVRQLEEKELPLMKAWGSVVSRDIYAPIMQPPFDRSPLDGYAVRAADIEQAKPSQPAVLEVVDRIIAGDKAAVPVKAGQAVRLMTGCMIPEGADYIVRQEDTDLGEQFVQVFKPGIPYGNFCRAGEEYCVGDLLLPAGLKIDAAALAVAAGAGITELPVIRRANVAILSTGNELQLLGSPLEPAKIYDANVAYLGARLVQLDAHVVEKHLVGDDRQLIVKTLTDCLKTADVILSTGGVSVGEMDLMEQAVLEIGAEILFHCLDVKPGMPTMVAVKDETLIIALSGNPFAATVPFELLIRPVLAKMTGDHALDLQRDIAIAAKPFFKASPTRRFLRGYVDEKQMVHIPDAQANGQMRSMIGCNCLIEIPSGCSGIQAGEQLQIIRL